MPACIREATRSELRLFLDQVGHERPFEVHLHRSSARRGSAEPVELAADGAIHFTIVDGCNFHRHEFRLIAGHRCEDAVSGGIEERTTGEMNRVFDELVLILRRLYFSKRYT